ncbi:calmodulin-like protein [Trifolium pratense]|uniref:Calmodulin-like protein n=1 Tax=Trifolium pratense TaxID=57577 RepID=A0A2K3LMZ0_TRIPR|nr:calmodulin-like protein [Trifolium pratense]
MPKRTKSEEEGTSTSSESESESEQTVRNGSTMSEYEKQRLQRIAENQARLKAMGLPQMVTSLKNSTPIKKKKGKEKVQDDDEEYIPENEEEREPESDSDSSSEEQHEHDSDYENPSGSRKRKVQVGSLGNWIRRSNCVILRAIAVRSGTND